MVQQGVPTTLMAPSLPTFCPFHVEAGPNTKIYFFNSKLCFYCHHCCLWSDLHSLHFSNVLPVQSLQNRRKTKWKNQALPCTLTDEAGFCWFLRKTGRCFVGVNHCKPAHFNLFYSKNMEEKTQMRPGIVIPCVGGCSPCQHGCTAWSASQPKANTHKQEQ